MTSYFLRLKAIISFVSLSMLSLAGICYSADVDLYTGTAIHRVPIEVPPGPGGLAPSFSLVYDGNEVNDWLGIGWRLEGVSFIEHKGKKALGTPDTLSTVYELVLGDISQRLINTTGNYYRTEQETFLRILKGFGNTWTVTDRSGVQYFFGENHSSSKPSILGAPGRVYLTRIRDTHGNEINYSYQIISPGGDLYLDRVTYGPGGNEEVAFQWNSRPDHRLRPVSGYGYQSVSISQRLTAIEVRLANDLVRRYVLGYSDSDATVLGHAKVSLTFPPKTVPVII